MNLLKQCRIIERKDKMTVVFCVTYGIAAIIRGLFTATDGSFIPNIYETAGFWAILLPINIIEVERKIIQK